MTRANEAQSDNMQMAIDHIQKEAGEVMTPIGVSIAEYLCSDVSVRGIIAENIEIITEELYELNLFKLNDLLVLPGVPNAVREAQSRDEDYISISKEEMQYSMKQAIAVEDVEDKPHIQAVLDLISRTDFFKNLKRAWKRRSRRSSQPKKYSNGEYRITQYR